MQMQTFYRKDGSAIRMRADLNLCTDWWMPGKIDFCDVTVSTSKHAKQLVGCFYGVGRYAPVRNITVQS